MGKDLITPDQFRFGASKLRMAFLADARQVDGDSNKAALAVVTAG